MGRAALAAGVGDLDAQEAGGLSELQLEVAAGDAAMRRGIGCQLGNEEGGTVGHLGPVRDTPPAQLLESEPAGEAGAARGGAEALGEHTYGDGLLGSRGC